MDEPELQRSLDQAARGGRGSHPRGEDTRQRILSAAMEVFATQGFDGTTTRRLADMAQVKLPAIQYYFGNKEGLYRAVVAHLVETMDSRVAPAAERVTLALAEEHVPRDELINLLCLMLETFASLVTDQSFPDWKSRVMFFARAEIEPLPALDQMHEWAVRRIIKPCAAVVGRLMSQPADQEATLLRTLMILGQVFFFCNQKGPRVLGWEQIDEARVKAIQSLVREHTQAIFRTIQGPEP
jgi:TetR/AcrR family transcriptional regulator, regulator of cefoperazone and chloramphenicol sensitivity